MPQCCAVPFCSEKKGGHIFPKDKTVLKQWLVAIRRNNYTPTKHSRVCKKHFNPEDYVLPKESNTEKPTPKLKPKVVPSQFSWNQESEERKEIKRKRAERVHQRQKNKLETAILSSTTEETQHEEHLAECEPVIAAIREQIEHLLLLRTEIKSEACFEDEIKIEDSHTFDPNQTDPFSARTERNVPEIDICEKDSDTVEDNIPDLNTDTDTDRPPTAPKLILKKSTDLIDRPQSPPICVLTKSTSLAPWVDKHVPVIKISKKQIVPKLIVKKTTDFKDRPQTAPKIILTKCTVLAPKVLKISKKLSETVPKIKAVFPELNTHPEPDRPQISPKVIPTKSTECSSEVRVVAYKSVPGGPIKRILIGNSSKAKKAKESWNNKRSV